MELFIGLFIGALSLLVIYIKFQQSYWSRRGIPHNKPAFIMGNMSGWQKTKHISKIFAETYQQFKGTGPFAGFYFLVMKMVIVTDLDLVKNILIKDFSNFDERGIFHNDRDDPLTGNLFFTGGEKWRQLRHKLSPTFTSGKMKNMFSTVVTVGQELATVFGEKTEAAKANGSVLEITDLLSRYTADVIGSCAFGLECNSLRDPNAEFVVIGKRFFTTPRHGKLIDFFIHSCPDMARRLRLRVVDQSVHEFYTRIVRETIAYRAENQVKRNDFMDILIGLMKSVKDENGVELGGLSIEDVTAQAFVFFLAGFETSSTTMGFALYELAQHQDIQDKVRAEINKVLAQHNGNFTYESMRDMQYLDQVIDETLRMHPILAHLVRKARDRYETADPKYFIEKGTMVIIPSLAIHRDPDYFPEPEKFKPERFGPEEAQLHKACTWLPFGEGPRNCVGLRFGKMQVSIGLAMLLKNFRFSVAAETQVPYQLANKVFTLSCQNGIHLKVERV